MIRILIFIGGIIMTITGAFVGAMSYIAILTWLKVIKWNGL